MLFSKNKPLDFGLIKRFFDGADDGTFVAPRCAVGGFRCAKSACRFAGAPPPHKACGFAGSPFFGGFKSSSYKETRHHSVVPCFLVRMMGLEPKKKRSFIVLLNLLGSRNGFIKPFYKKVKSYKQDVFRVQSIKVWCKMWC